MSNGTHCWKHDIWYPSLSECPRCLAEESSERQREHFDRQEDANRASEEMERERNELLREQEEASQQRHEEHLGYLRGLEKQRREQREEELRAEREAREEETERRREISEAEIADHREIAANAWQLQAESKRERGWELFTAGLHEEGLEKLNESVKEDPGNLDSWVSLATAYRLLGDEPNQGRATRKQLGLLTLPKYGKYIGNFERTLDELSGLQPEFLVEFTSVLSERCVQVEAGDSNVLDTWQGLARLFKSISNSAGWSRSIQNQIRLLHHTDVLKDFVFVLDQIPRGDTNLSNQVGDILISRSTSMKNTRNDPSDMSKLLDRGFFTHVCVLLRGMPQDLTALGLLLWAHKKATAAIPTCELDSYLQGIPNDKRFDAWRQYSGAYGVFANVSLNLDPDREIRNILFTSLRDQYVRWTPQISVQFRALAVQQANMNAIRDGSEKWAKGAAAAALVIAMFLPTIQLKVWGAVLLCLSAYLFVREMLSKALLLEAAKKGYQALRASEWNQWRTLLVDTAEPYDSIPPPPSPAMPSAHLKVAFVAGGLVLVAVLWYGARVYEGLNGLRGVPVIE